jgi:cytochrome c oxidase assembly protein subunit 15
MISENARRQVIIWLALGCFLIFSMVIIGGITRLTGSGLSIVDWKLISGTVPPMNEVEWEKSFEAYKQFPQYEVQPEDFILSDFKQIYWWEYIHRLLGRLIGLVFILPFLYFIFTKKIKGSFIWKGGVLLFLGGLQGFIGWYMVKSGLVNNPHVSHYRLALHLTMAFLTFAYTFWLMLEILFPNKLAVFNQKAHRQTVVLLVLVAVQIVYGAFVAGLKAGLFYNTFPKMGDEWIAAGVTALSPFYLNLFESIAGVQFIHRYLGIAILVFALYYLSKWWRSKENRLFSEATKYIGIIILVQVSLGIMTLIYGVPIILAVMHQIVAFFLVMNLIYALRISSHSS